MLYVITLYFLLLIIKFVFKLIGKGLNLFRIYIHNITDEKKIGEVILWTLFGVVIGVVLNGQITSLWQGIVNWFNNTILPFINGLL